MHNLQICTPNAYLSKQIRQTEVNNNRHRTKSIAEAAMGHAVSLYNINEVLTSRNTETYKMRC